MKKNRIFLSVSLVLLLMIFIVNVAGASNFKVIEDQMGRQVTIPADVKRVVTTWKPSTFMVFAVGGEEKLVGVDNSSTVNKFLTGVYPGIKNIRKVGDKRHGLNIEEIVGSDPDVVIIWSGKGSGRVIEQLESLKIPTVVLIPESIELMKEAALLLGEVLNEQEQARKMIDYYNDTLELVENRVGNIPKSEKKKVYLAGAYGIFSSCGSDFYQHFMLESAGGIDVATGMKGGWVEISPEQLVKWNPDVMVAVQYCMGPGMEEIVSDNPQLQSIGAVKNNELYRFPSNLGPWDYPEPRSILGLLWLSNILYPEKYEDIDILEEIDKFHVEFFGKTFTELGGKLGGKGINAREKKH